MKFGFLRLRKVGPDKPLLTPYGHPIYMESNEFERLHRAPTFGPLAHQVEHLPFKQVVPGSSPGRLTNYLMRILRKPSSDVPIV